MELFSNILSKDQMKTRTRLGEATARNLSNVMKSKPPKSLPTEVREPDDAEERAIAAARQTIAEMPPRFEVGTKIKTENGATQILQVPKHSDQDGWRAQFMAAFGTTSETVVGVEMQRIANALRRDGKIDPAELDAVIAIISGQRPRNEIEAMIISQMAVTHALTMRSLGNLNRSCNIQQQDSNALTVARLTKGFTSQVDALARLRRGGEQRVVVEHVHVYQGGQAIVGAVTHTGAPRALIESQGQPHATDNAGAIIAPDSKAMRSQDPDREAMPISNSEGPQAVPNARRRTRIRRAKRRA
jgi:hypothetical protein